MSGEKCVVEGCNLEYDVICSFSFYNVNTIEENDDLRQEWIDGAMNEESECLWRHVSLQLCGYHFELDSQGLWIDSPMLPELLTIQEPPPAIEPTEEQKKAAEIIRMEHNYYSVPAKVVPEPASRLNVRQLVDTLGYLSLKNLQRKQLWVVKVETDKAEASITQSEQVITKMQEPKQIIEIIPQDSTSSTEPTTSSAPEPELEQSEQYQILDESTISDNFIYEIAEEQEITMDEVKEIPSDPQNWTVNIIPDESKAKYAYIKHCNSGKKKRHFTAEMSEITLQGDFDNYYILPDVDPSSGVEVTTSYEPETYIVEDYQQLVLETPQKRPNEKRRKKKKVKTEVTEDWSIGEVSYDRDESDDYDPKKRKTKSAGKKYEAFFVG